VVANAGEDEVEPLEIVPYPVAIEAHREARNVN
jgi:hypothetical protein